MMIGLYGLIMFAAYIQQYFRVQTTFIKAQNSMNHNQTAPKRAVSLIRAHTVCIIGNLCGQAAL